MILGRSLQQATMKKRLLFLVQFWDTIFQEPGIEIAISSACDSAQNLTCLFSPSLDSSPKQQISAQLDLYPGFVLVRMQQYLRRQIGACSLYHGWQLLPFQPNGQPFSILPSPQPIPSFSTIARSHLPIRQSSTFFSRRHQHLSLLSKGTINS